MSILTWGDLKAAILQMDEQQLEQPVYASAGTEETIPVFSMQRIRGQRSVFTPDGDYLGIIPPATPMLNMEPTCRHCGCVEQDCSGCIERTGQPCYWVSADECSACVADPAQAAPRA